MDDQRNHSPDHTTLFPRKAMVSGAWRTASEASQICSHTIDDRGCKEQDTDYERIPRFSRYDGMILPKIPHRPPQQLQTPIKYTGDTEGKSQKRPKLVFCKNYSPWLKYEKFKKESKPGKTCIANAIDSPGMIVAIKEYRDSRTYKAFLQRTDHPNIVNLLDAFEESKTLYLAYELMDISLMQLQACVTLEESDLGYISKELLHGLWYIHRGLGICHTGVTSDNIFISSRGNVKIANIAKYLLERHQGCEQLDIKSIGHVLCNIVEPASAMLGCPRNDTNISTGSDQLKMFISKTAHTKIPTLLQDVFIAQAAKEGCLVVPVMKIRGLILHDYD